MPEQPFKFRHVNEIAGSFVLVLAALIITAVVVVGRAQHWFEPGKLVTVNMPAEGSLGLKAGAEVRMLGTNVGAIEHVDIDDQGQMTAVARVKADFARFVRSDSYAVIHVPVGFGDPYLEIIKGQAAALISSSKLEARPETDAQRSLNETLETIRTKTVPAVQDLVREYTLLASDLRNPEGPVQRSLQHFDNVAARLEKNDSLVGKLVNDHAMADSFASSIDKLNSSMDNVQGMLKSLQETAVELPKIARSASAQVDQLPPMIEQTHKAVEQVNVTLGSLQKATAELPIIMEQVRQTTEQMPHLMEHTQQTLLEVQKLIRAMQQLPLIRDHIDSGAGNAAPNPATVGGEP